MTGLGDLEEDWVHRPTPVKAVPFTGFGRDGNGQRVLAWLRSHNVEAKLIGGNILFDNGTDDLPIQAAPGDGFVRDPEDDTIHRVKSHKWDDLYERGSGLLPTNPEDVARAFHESYERLAPGHGYETRKASAVPWDRVPANNRALMVAVVTDLLERGVIAS